MVKAQPFFHLSAWVSGFPDVAVSMELHDHYFGKHLRPPSPGWGLFPIALGLYIMETILSDLVVMMLCDVVRAVFRLVQVCLRVGRGETLCETLKIRKRCFVW